MILHCLQIPSDPNSSAFLHLVPAVGHKSRAGEQAHAACHPFPWFLTSDALKGLGLGGDLFQKEGDAALTPVLFQG